MLAKAFVIVGLIFHSASAKGQTTGQNNIVDNGIYILPTQLLFPEIILTFEHFPRQRLSYSYSLGYKIPTGAGNTLEPYGHGLIALYEYQYMFNEFSHAIYSSFAPSFYLNDDRKVYLQPELFYRYYWFDDKELFFDNFETDRFNSIRSERNHVMGVKFLAGFNNRIQVSPNTAINFKLYGGPGIRYKNYWYENVDNKRYVWEEDTTIVEPYGIEKDDFFILSIHLGLKLGIARTVKISN